MKTETFNSVWDALEDDPFEARAKERRANLMFKVQDWIEKGKWSQPEVAKKLGISQPRVSDVVQGKLSKFSLEALLGFLDRIGADVTIEVRHPKKVTGVEKRLNNLRVASGKATIQAVNKRVAKSGRIVVADGSKAPTKKRA